MAHGVQGRAHVGTLDADTAHDVARTMQALATASRVRILGRLRESACSVGELADAIAMEQSAVSHQLRILRHLGLVVGERRGRSVVYALNRGVPFFLSNREAQVSQDVLRLATAIVGEARVAPLPAGESKAAKSKSLFAWR